MMVFYIIQNYKMNMTYLEKRNSMREQNKQNYEFNQEIRLRIPNTFAIDNVTISLNKLLFSLENFWLGKYLVVLMHV